VRKFFKPIFNLIFLTLILLSYTPSGRAAAPASNSSRLELPAMSGPVVDEAGLLSPRAVQILNTLARDEHNKDLMQLQILTLKSLNGIPIEQASIEIVDRWKIGSKPKDNGVLFLIVPSERVMRIEVGRGLEGDLPDITAKRIIGDVVTPYFKSQRYDDGVVAGALSIARTVDPNIQIEGTQPAMQRPDRDDRNSHIGFLAIFIVFILLRLIFGRRSYGSGIFYGGGGGFGGGGGGGGWSGGGGSFNGGGASGQW
jgi:uncharacterized protein